MALLAVFFIRNILPQVCHLDTREFDGSVCPLLLGLL
jgi:hypothetical protein